MKCRNILISLGFLSLFLFACAANQTISKTTPDTASAKERIVEMYVEGCV